MGVCFVSFVSQYGYDRVLSVLGRHMRDFLNGLDNLHEYLKFSYPRMKAPSFICENETKQGLTLHYRSKRRGFVYYTMGQIREVCISDFCHICLPLIPTIDDFAIVCSIMCRWHGISITKICTLNWYAKKSYSIRSMWHFNWHSTIVHSHWLHWQWHVRRSICPSVRRFCSRYFRFVLFSGKCWTTLE